MRPRIEGEEESKVISMVSSEYKGLSPTQLIEMLINTHYQELYPSGEEKVDGKIKEDKAVSKE